MTYAGYVVEVLFSKRARKQLSKLPKHVAATLAEWVDLVSREELAGPQSIPGYHEEVLRGERRGQRSSRLSRAWRVIYRVDAAGEITIVLVLEVSKHEY